MKVDVCRKVLDKYLKCYKYDCIEVMVFFFCCLLNEIFCRLRWSPKKAFQENDNLYKKLN